jgi:hypothetical protein
MNALPHTALDAPATGVERVLQMIADEERFIPAQVAACVHC